MAISEEFSWPLTPAAARAEPPKELGIADFCWTPAGDILAPNPLACDCPDCGCFAAFVGVKSAKATTWGVVEIRPVAQVTAAVRGGAHVRGWQIVEDSRRSSYRRSVRSARGSGRSLSVPSSASE